MVQIRSWKSGEVLFEYEGTIKEAVEEAVRQDISLRCAYLEGADLNGANLQGANLQHADLISADLRYANLNGADLRYAHLKGADLISADLYGANLKWAHLECADLSGAHLRGANISGVDLTCANISGADLKVANLYNTSLYNTNLSKANLIKANLEGANLVYANLSNADFNGANLYGADLTYAKNIPNDIMPLACPTEGSFIAWKKVSDKLVKLEIPEDAKRSSATTHKCRCSKAKVLAITNLFETETFEQVFNGNYATLTYRVGKMVYPDWFDEDRWNECSNGIHFFMNKEDALNW